MKNRSAVSRNSWLKHLVVCAATTLTAAGATLTTAHAAGGIQAGTLVCKGEGGWGAIIASKKTFDCTFGSIGGKFRGSYTGVIRKYGLDIGVTGDSTLTWLVFGPAKLVGNNYKLGSLAGEYFGAGAEASLGLGVGANALVGGSDDSFALQPVSVQVQTGIGIAVGVETLKLEYVGLLD